MCYSIFRSCSLGVHLLYQPNASGGIVFKPSDSKHVVTGSHEKPLRYQKTREGLHKNVSTIGRLLEVAKQLPKGEGTFSSDVQHRRKNHKLFLDFIVKGHPDANLDKTVGYGAALEVKMIQELEALFDHSDDDFADKAHLIEELDPSAFITIKAKFDEALRELTEAIDREKESAEFEHIVVPYMKVYNLINPLFTEEMGETLLDRQIEERERRQRENKQLVDLIGKL